MNRTTHSVPGLDPRAQEIIPAAEMQAGFDRLAAAIQPLVDLALSEACRLERLPRHSG